MTLAAHGRLFVMYDLWPRRQLFERRPPLPFDRQRDPAHLVSSCADNCPKALIGIITNPVNTTVAIAAEVLKNKGVLGIRTESHVRKKTKKAKRP